MTIDIPLAYVYDHLGASGKTPLSCEFQYFWFEASQSVYVYETVYNGVLYRKEIPEKDILSDPQLVIDTVRLELLFSV
jgi:hypothetical protein